MDKRKTRKCPIEKSGERGPPKKPKLRGGKTEGPTWPNRKRRARKKPASVGKRSMSKKSLKVSAAGKQHGTERDTSRWKGDWTPKESNRMVETSWEKNEQIIRFLIHESRQPKARGADPEGLKSWGTEFFSQKVKLGGGGAGKRGYTSFRVGDSTYVEGGDKTLSAGLQ